MLAFLKYMKGYVRIRVWGPAPERFMNLCSNKEILLWNIQKRENEYTMCISLQAFYQLRPIARKTGTRVVILQRVGLPFFVPVIFARKVFCVGLILCVAFWIASGYFVWDIQCIGNYQITDDLLLSFMEQKSVKVGMFQRRLDIEDLEKSIRRQFPQVTWTSVRLSGTKLIVEIKENDVPLEPVIIEDQGGKDLVAEYNGTIMSMIVRSGVPKVSIGQEVTEGMVLVEGKIPIYNEDTTIREYIYVTADADICIRYHKYHEESIPFEHIQKVYTGRKKKGYYLRLADKELKIADETPFLVYDSVMKEHTAGVLEKLSIPLLWGSITSREYLNVEYKYTLTEAKEQLTEKMNKYIISLEEKGVHIIEKNVRIDTKNDNWVMSADMVVEEMAIKQIDTTDEERPPLEADTAE